MNTNKIFLLRLLSFLGTIHKSAFTTAKTLSQTLYKPKNIGFNSLLLLCFALGSLNEINAQVTFSGAESSIGGWYQDPGNALTYAPLTTTTTFGTVGSGFSNASGFLSLQQNGTSTWVNMINVAPDLATAKAAGKFYGAVITPNQIIRPTSLLLGYGPNGGGNYTFNAVIYDPTDNSETLIYSGAASTVNPPTAPPQVAVTAFKTMLPGINYQYRIYPTSAGGGTKVLDNIQIYAQAGTCPTGITAPNLTGANYNSTTNAFIIPNGSTTANLSSITASNPNTNYPVISWHSGTPATVANRINNITTVPPGTYYAAFATSDGACFSNTRAICIGNDSDSDGVPNPCDLDDDNDGILDTNEGMCTPSAAITPAADKINYDVGGYSIYTIGNNTNGLGWQESGFQQRATQNNITLSDPAINWPAFTSISTASSIIPIANSGTLEISEPPGSTNPFINTADAQASGNGTGTPNSIAVRNGPTGSGANAGTVKYTMTWPAGSNVKMVGFDLVDIGDWANVNEPSINATVKVNDTEVWYFNRNSVGSALTGTISILNSSSGTSQGSMTIGENIENFIGISSAVVITKVEILINYPVATTAVDLQGIDNLVVDTNCHLDTDGDGTPNYLDLDSDNDGCLDAIEGSANVQLSQLVTAGGNVTSGTGSTAPNQNLCAGSTCVDTNGLPTIMATLGAPNGQLVGSSANAAVKDPYCTPPVANNDNLLNQLPGAVTFPNILSNDSDANATLSPNEVSLIAPSGATGIITDAQGDVTGFTVPGQGTWSYNSSTGALTFTPQSGYTGNPTPINYTVQSTTGPVSNQATVTVTYASADISIVKTVSNPTPNSGSAITFSLVVTNNGPNDATGVAVTDALPSGYTYQSAVAPAGTTIAYTTATSTLAWNIGNLVNGASTTLTITALANSSGNYTNTATVTAAQTDPNTANNTSSVSTTPVIQNECMGSTATKLNLSGGVLISGTANTVGAKYKYSNVIAGTGVTQQADIVFELTALDFGSSLLQSNYDFIFDAPQSTAGIENNFQPSFVRSTSGSVSNIPTGTYHQSSTWKATVYKAGTTTPYNVPTIIQVIDNDGSTSATIDIFESVEFLSPLPAQIITSTPTTQVKTGNVVKSNGTPQSGIGVDPQYSAYGNYGYANEFSFKLDNEIVIKGSPSINSNLANRYASVNFGCDFSGTNNFTKQIIRGTVYTDTDGGTPSGLPYINGNVYANLVDPNGNIVASQVASTVNGSYSFSNVIAGTYKVLLTNTAQTVGSVAPVVSSLPPNYDNVTSTDATPTDGITTIVVTNVDLDGINFGINLSVCYESPTDLTTSVPVKHGITVLGRAGKVSPGSDNTATDWPMIRNSAYTALEGKTKGFVVTRNSSPETTITNPVVGMMVFDTDEGATGCLKIYTGSGAGEGWKCFSTQTCP